MHHWFAQVRLADVQGDVRRNIVSIRVSQDLFDDLSAQPEEWALAQSVESSVKPPNYQSPTPVIDRPFEAAAWCNAIEYPFKHWQKSRYSDGSFGVWYGSDDVQTTVYETLHHWRNGLLRDAGWDVPNTPIIAERRVYLVACHAALLDFRPLIARHPELIAPDDYQTTQSIGARFQREGHPGLVTLSARHETGVNYAIFNPKVLSNPRHECFLTYRLLGEKIEVEKEIGVVWLRL